MPSPRIFRAAHAATNFKKHSVLPLQLTLLLSGTFGADALNVKVATGLHPLLLIFDRGSLPSTDQTGSTSQVKSLALNKGGDTAPTIPVDTVIIATALAAPDPTFGQVEFAKSTATNTYGSGGVAIESAINAPKKPVHVNAVDKTQVVRNNYAE